MTKFIRTVFVDKYSFVKSEPTYTNQLINLHYIRKICPVDNYPNLLQVFLIDEHQELHYVFAKDLKNALRETDEYGCTLIQKIQNEYDGQTE